MFHAFGSRMHQGVLAGAIVLCSSSLVSAQSTEYYGAGFLTDFVNCSGWSSVAQLYARHRPAGEPGNPAHYNSFSMFSQTFAFGYRFQPDPPVNQWIEVLGVGNVGGNVSYDSEPDPRPEFRLLTPPIFTTGTDREMHVVFEIRNFSYEAGCQTRGNFLLYRRND